MGFCENWRQPGMLRPTKSVPLNDDAEFEKVHSILSKLLKFESDALGQPPFAFEIAQKVSAVLNKLTQNDIQNEVPLDSEKLCFNNLKIYGTLFIAH
jgi:hypothetical protein